MVPLLIFYVEFTLWEKCKIKKIMKKKNLEIKYHFFL